jgi:hypothetical protein
MRLGFVPGLLALALGACTSVADLGRPSKPLMAGEPAQVRKKSEEALRQKEWVLSWNHEVAAGADRSALEEIALQALDDEDGDAEEMFAQLRKKFGGVTEGAAARVKSMTEKAVDLGDWDRAAEIQILAADDAPTYRGAWDVYAVTPAAKAMPILEKIQKARADWQEAQARKKAQ